MTAAMRQLLIAATDRILPPDAWPGAADAHVIGYIDWITAQDRFQPMWPVLFKGIELLESLAQGSYERSFACCTPEERDSLLTRLQEIPHPTAQRFLRMLVNMTLTGYFGDPAYGGNRDGIVWTRWRITPDIAPDADQSLASARIGSTRAARRAGT